MSAWKKSNKSIFQNLALVSQVGIMMLIPILGCVLVGAFLDRFFKTSGIFLIIFVLLGVGSAFRNLYVLSINRTKDYKNDQSPSSYVDEFEKKVQREKDQQSHQDHQDHQDH